MKKYSPLYLVAMIALMMHETPLHFIAYTSHVLDFVQLYWIWTYLEPMALALEDFQHESAGSKHTPKGLDGKVWCYMQKKNTR